ncbi:MAG: hypothetical protein JXA18_17305 [Chitinispirillaceae bacterium]|nr:hypothetical protein [Chitinispirillaceae bacterium]
MMVKSAAYIYLSLILLSLFFPFIANASSAKLPDLQRLVRPPDTIKIDSSVILTSDSAYFKLPVAREALNGTTTPVHLVPRCSVDSAVIYVRHSSSQCDTLARLHRPPYLIEWNYAALPDQDQIHLQFGYKLFRPDGRMIIVKALPHRWAIDRTMKKSRKTYHCRQAVKPDTPVVDGKLDDWKHVRHERIGDRGRFALRWNGAFLFFAAEVRSKDIGPSDIIELHLDPRRTRSSFASEVHRSIRFGPRGRSYCFVSCNSGSGYSQCDSIVSLLKEGMAWSISRSDTGYCIEAALPLYALSDLDFPNLRSGLDVTIRTGNSPARFDAWANSREYNRYNPSEWGTIVLHQAMLPIKIALLAVFIISMVICAVITVVALRHFFRTERFEREEAKDGSEALQRIRVSVKEHLSDPSLTIGAVAEKSGLPADTVAQTLHEELDCSFEKFLCFQRVMAVKKVLWNFSMPLDAIARQCGFLSTDAMAMRFREYQKTDPESFRRKIMEMASEEGESAAPHETSGQK